MAAYRGTPIGQDTIMNIGDPVDVDVYFSNSGHYQVAEIADIHEGTVDARLVSHDGETTIIVTPPKRGSEQAIDKGASTLTRGA
jgi:hypothetical protein